jgi:fructoselysine 6-kinase
MKAFTKLTPRIASVGDNCVDIYPGLNNETFVGGNGVNLAVAVCRSNVECSYVGIVGNDPNGKKIVEVLNHEGVDTRQVSVHQGATAWTRIKLIQGDRILEAEDIGVQRKYNLTEADYRFIFRHDWVHYTAFTNWPTAYAGALIGYYQKIDRHTARLHANGMRISMDFSDNDMSRLLDIVQGRVEIGFFSRVYQNPENLKIEFDKLARYGFNLTVITLGDQGSAAYDGQYIYRQEAIKVPVVDTLGAGDAYMGAFLSQYTKGFPIPECLLYASEYAALVCTRFGAF